MDLVDRIGFYSGSAVLDGSYVGISGIAVGASGNVYLADTSRNRIQVFGAVPSSVTRSTTTRLSAPTSVKVRHTLKLSGSVAPSTALGSVTIVMKRKVGSRWKSAGTAKVKLVSGKYRYSFKPGKRGRWRLTAKYSGGKAGTTTYKASLSAGKTVLVK
jgi:hypothetical protein